MAINRTIREIRKDLFSLQHTKEPKTIILFGKPFSPKDASCVLFTLEQNSLLAWSKHKDKIEITNKLRLS